MRNTPNGLNFNKKIKPSSKNTASDNSQKVVDAYLKYMQKKIKANSN
ncbi:MAG: hypothetical protein R2828_28075 [Saprospiraceae bacterium]